MTEEKKEVFDLSQNAVLMTMRKGYWEGKTPDRELARELEAAHGAEEGTAGAYKYVLDRETWLTGQRICKAAYKYFTDHSLPWGDGGLRLVRSDQFNDMIAKLTEFKSQLIDHAEEMVGKYEVLYERAKEKLNGMFKEGEFPTPEQLREKYHMDWDVMPIAKTDDVRLKGLTQSEIDKMIAETRDQVAAMLKKAQQEMLGRLHQVVDHMSTSLTSTVKGSGGDAKQKTFRDTLVGNISDLVAVLPSLNITHDPEIEAMIAKVKAELTSVTPQSLRDDPKVRKDVAGRAASLLKELKGIKL